MPASFADHLIFHSYLDPELPLCPLSPHFLSYFTLFLFICNSLNFSYVLVTLFSSSDFLCLFLTLTHLLSLSLSLPLSLSLSLSFCLSLSFSHHLLLFYFLSLSISFFFSYLIGNLCARSYCLRNRYILLCSQRLSNQCSRLVSK